MVTSKEIAAVFAFGLEAANTGEKVSELAHWTFAWAKDSAWANGRHFESVEMYEEGLITEREFLEKLILELAR